MRFVAATSCALLAVSLFAAPCSTNAQEARNANMLEVGGKPPGSTVATFAQGSWRKKQKDACPILLQRDDPKIAVYVRNLDVPSLAIAKAIDQVITDKPSLKWSFLMIDNSHSPESILESRLSMTQEAAAYYQITNLSLGLFSTLEASASGENTRARKHLTVLGNSDIVVCLVIPLVADAAAGSQTIPTVVYVKTLQSSEVSSEVIRTTVADVIGSFNEHANRLSKP